MFRINSQDLIHHHDGSSQMEMANLEVKAINTHVLNHHLTSLVSEYHDHDTPMRRLEQLMHYVEQNRDRLHHIYSPTEMSSGYWGGNYQHRQRRSDTVTESTKAFDQFGHRLQNKYRYSSRHCTARCFRSTNQLNSWNGKWKGYQLNTSVTVGNLGTSVILCRKYEIIIPIGKGPTLSNRSIVKTAVLKTGIGMNIGTQLERILQWLWHMILRYLYPHGPFVYWVGIIRGNYFRRAPGFTNYWREQLTFTSENHWFL